MQESTFLWQSGSGPDELSGSEVHLWKTCLDHSPALSPALHGVLSPEEESMAEAFHFEKDRVSFRMSRGYLRTLLGRYTGAAPSEIRFRTGERGKLSLDPRVHAEPVEFNVSHSGNMVLLVLSRDRRVGVDVERIRPAARIDEISRAFFSSQEDESIRALRDAAKVAAFYACWTRKEAAVKAFGGSIMELSAGVVVSSSPAEPARLLRLPREHGGPDGWHLHDLPVGRGYAAALCYEGPPAEVFLWK
jgi:4'-phosphopantetheinyl transferase